MATAHGWWKLSIDRTDSDVDTPIELGDADLEHIAELIKKGYTEGEIVRDDNDDSTP
jgi:hypothetical protein